MRRRLVTGLLIILFVVTLFPLTVSAQERLTERFTSDDGLLTFRYPDEWVAVEMDETGLIIMGNDGFAPIRYFDKGYVESGELVMLVFRPEIMRSALDMSGLPRDPSAEDILQVVVDARDVDDDDVTVLGQEEFATALIAGGDQDQDHMLLVVKLDRDQFILFDCIADRFELTEFIDSIFSIAFSVRYDARTVIDEPDTDQPDVQLTETYVLSDGTFALDYPDGWFVQEKELDSGALIIYLASDEDLFENLPRRNSDVLVFILPPGSANSLFEEVAPNMADDMAETNRIVMIGLSLIGDGVDLGENVEFTLDGRPAIRMEGEGTDYDMVTITVDLGDQVTASGFALVNAGTLNTHIATVQAVVASFSSAPPAAGTDSSQVPIFGDASATPAVEVEPTTTPVPIDCRVYVSSQVNKRGGPGISYAVVGTLEPGTELMATGQINSVDGFTWLQLTDGSWVRSDVVNKSGNCEELPLVQPGG